MIAMKEQRHSQSYYGESFSTPKIQCTDPIVLLERELAQHVPQFFTPTSLIEKVCSCFRSRRLQLEESHMRKYLKLANTQVQAYSEKNQAHERALYKLYLLVFKDAIERVPKNLQTHKWLEIGFLTKNPRIEFRSGGFLGLQSIRFFIKNYHEVFKQILANGSEYFFFALSSINITTFLINFLFLGKDIYKQQSIPTFEVPMATKDQFKTFCRLNQDSKQTIFELHCYALRYLYILWSIESNKPKLKRDRSNSDGPPPSDNSQQSADYNKIMKETWQFVQKIMDTCEDVSRLEEMIKIAHQIMDQNIQIRCRK
ncbi:hypothetical protein FGO68_gene3408 [Halteria grandinella]|uniref:ELMO domain-containing protein n=1 Tax=Halteria grandinella TaxID=5974 RepID=A0A8J8T2K6_HALGN|nr:hypothetical protein FGO68_gene3408 [Halteria grandinella]